MLKTSSGLYVKSSELWRVCGVSCEVLSNVNCCIDHIICKTCIQWKLVWFVVPEHFALIVVVTGFYIFLYFRNTPRQKFIQRTHTQMYESKKKGYFFQDHLYSFQIVVQLDFAGEHNVFTFFFSSVFCWWWNYSFSPFTESDNT